MEKMAAWPECQNLWKKSPRQFRTAFLTAMTVGAVVHLYMFTNMLPDHDAMGCFITANDHLSLGRWALAFFSAFSTDYQLPLVTGMLSLFAIAVSAGLAIQLLRITHPVSIVLAAALMATYPSVACVLSFMFTADAYFIALLLNVFGVWCTKKYRRGWLGGIFCLTVSLGIYQGYICCAIGLMLFDCILDVMEQAPLKAIFSRGGKYIAVIAAAFAGYYVLLQVFLKLSGTGLSAYKGISEMGRLPIRIYLHAAAAAFFAFIKQLLRTPYLSGAMRGVQLAFFLVSGMLFLFVVTKRKVYRSIVHLLLIGIGALLTPLALNFAHVMQGRVISAVSDSLTTYSFVFFFVFMIKVSEDAAALMPQKPPRGGGYFPVLA